MDASAEDLVCVLCVCVYIVCVCVRPIVYAFKTKTMFVVCLCCVLLCCGDHVFEFVRVERCVDESSRDLV